MVADQTRERDAVRRIVDGERLSSGALDDILIQQRRASKRTQADLDAGTARTWPSCCGACRRGTGICPTPQACQISTEPDSPRPPPRGGDMLRVIAFLLCAWAAVAASLLAMGVHL
ncbi:MAG: hypothetical protein RJA36_476 [Pseudomonadota bacterium]|jgi:hypothetical protein